MAKVHRGRELQGTRQKTNTMGIILAMEFRRKNFCEMMLKNEGGN